MTSKAQIAGESGISVVSRPLWPGVFWIAAHQLAAHLWI
jgi:hypothetical protein